MVDGSLITKYSSGNNDSFSSFGLFTIIVALLLYLPTNITSSSSENSYNRENISRLAYPS